jgi:hypothetical protein
VFFSLENGVFSEENLSPSCSLFCYDITTGETITLSEFTPPDFAMNNFLYMSGILYLIDKRGDMHDLLQIDVNNADTQLVVSYPSKNLILDGIFPLDDGIVSFRSESVSEEERVYHAEIIDCKTHERKALNLSDSSDISHPDIISLDTNRDKIYVFTEKGKPENMEYAIMEYSKDGKQTNRYPIDLSKFEYNDATVEVQGDPVYTIYENLGYYIYQTYNGRIRIEYLGSDEKLTPINIPGNMYSDIPSMFGYVGNKGLEYSQLYFICNSSISKESFYVMDVNKREFTSYILPFTYSQESIYSYYRNEEGDLIMLCDNTDTDQQQYYLIRVSESV